ncbi:MAG: serine hydrolase [Deltaproteobacteria bacterium]|nr:serine hydrolase [Deltaproteobacteria bacterium]
METRKLLSILLLLLIGITIHAQEKQTELTSTKLEEIDNFIRKNPKKWKTPGFPIVIINGKDEFQFQNYGYSNKKESLEVSEHTLFEFGSTSKAFTGLGLMMLVEE